MKYRGSRMWWSHLGVTSLYRVWNIDAYKGFESKTLVKLKQSHIN